MNFVRLASASLTLLIGGSVLEGSAPFYGEISRYQTHAFAGYRQDQLKFHIGGLNEHDRRGRHSSYSKVKLKDLKIAEIGGSFDYTTFNHFCVRLNGDYGKVCSGKASVRNDFYLHPRYCEEEGLSRQGQHAHGRNKKHKRPRHLKKEISEQHATANRGDVADLVGAVGWKIESAGAGGWVSFLAGYSGHTQSVSLSHFKQTKDSHHILGPHSGTGPIPHLHGKYSTHWQGPWVGCDFSTLIDYNVTAFGSGEWHWASYRADGYWTYGPAYKAHIRHTARGYGVVARLGLDWTPCLGWSYGIMGEFQQWSTRTGSNNACVRKGMEIANHLSTIFPVVKKSTLFHTQWVTFSILADVSYTF